MNRSLKLFLAAALTALTAAASAQTQAERQLSYLDLGLQGVGQFTRTVSGPVIGQGVFDAGQTVSESTSNTLGGLVTIRYAPKPYFGVEFNGGYVRYTDSFSSQAFAPQGVPQPFQIQTQANELTFGYLVTPGYTIFGLRPYASVGAGTIRFAPTKGGGQDAPQQGRLAAYYNLGVQKSLLANFGVRVGFRQLFFEAPDFVQNYLTTDKRTATTEPLIGFYLQF